MKKYIIFLLLILVSCQPDEILLPNSEPIQEMIFDAQYSVVRDGQDISFEIITNTQHQLIITQQDGSVITKETFTPTLGINTRKIYTKTFPKGTYNLILANDVETLNKTSIIIE